MWPWPGGTADGGRSACTPGHGVVRGSPRGRHPLADASGQDLPLPVDGSCLFSSAPGSCSPTVHRRLRASWLLKSSLVCDCGFEALQVLWGWKASWLLSHPGSWQQADTSEDPWRHDPLWATFGFSAHARCCKPFGNTPLSLSLNPEPGKVSLQRQILLIRPQSAAVAGSGYEVGACSAPHTRSHAEGLLDGLLLKSFELLDEHLECWFWSMLLLYCLAICRMLAGVVSKPSEGKASSQCCDRESQTGLLWCALMFGFWNRGLEFACGACF